MTHFAIICPAETSHLNPMFALRQLQRRGHRVTFIGVLDAQATTLAAELEFRAFAPQTSASKRDNSVDNFFKLNN